MPFTRALNNLDSQLARHSSDSETLGLRMPAIWEGDRPLWARLVARARLYARCRASYFERAAVDEVAVRLFDDLAQTAHLIRRGGALHELKMWLNSPDVRHNEDARALRNLIHIMESLEVF